MSIFCLAALICFVGMGDPGNETMDLKPRNFKLNYGAEILGLPAGANVKIWIPIPKSDELQKVITVDGSIPGGQLNHAKDPVYDNTIGFFETMSTANPIQFDIQYAVIRNESKPGLSVKKPLTPAERKRFLTANKMVPTEGEPLKLLKGQEFAGSTMDTGLALYEIVETFMTYDKSKPGYGNGDVLWACSSKTGNCTDFHSLFISLARSRQIPARFEIGFPIPKDKTSGTLGGYHCWAWFFTDEQGWVAVDISEADKHSEMKDYYFGRLTPDRVAFSTGRDIELRPPSKSGPLNYFVYPHVEVDGEVWPRKEIKLKLSFEDIKFSNSNTQTLIEN